MTKEIRRYMAEVERLLKDGCAPAEWERLRGEMLVRIGFYQHERLIHLIITMAFAVMTIVSFSVFFTVWQFGLVAAALFVLDIPYVLHYFFLENSTQKLYRLYYAVQGKAKEAA